MYCLIYTVPFEADINIPILQMRNESRLTYLVQLRSDPIYTQAFKLQLTYLTIAKFCHPTLSFPTPVICTFIFHFVMFAVFLFFPARQTLGVGSISSHICIPRVQSVVLCIVVRNSYFIEINLKNSYTCNCCNTGAYTHSDCVSFAWSILT